MRIHKPALMTALALVVLLAAACTAGVGAGTLPLGSYTNDTASFGPMVLTLADGGQYTLSVHNNLIQGTWKVTGDQIELTETKGGACTNWPATFKWVLDGNALSFALVNDTCLLNATAFDRQTWIRQP